MPKKETKITSTAIATATPKTDYEMVMNQFFNIDFSAMNKVIDNSFIAKMIEHQKGIMYYDNTGKSNTRSSNTN